MTELKGTFACPICGQDTPHHHTKEEIEAAQPTVSGVVAHCRLRAKHMRQYGVSETVSVDSVSAMLDGIAERLERLPT
jgi:uncharacterized Zn finger protein (UPF0148 family)